MSNASIVEWFYAWELEVSVYVYAWATQFNSRALSLLLPRNFENSQVQDNKDFLVPRRVRQKGSPQSGSKWGRNMCATRPYSCLNL